MVANKDFGFDVFESLEILENECKEKAKEVKTIDENELGKKYLGLGFNHIIDNIYLGAEYGTKSLATLKSCGITHILSVIKYMNTNPHKEEMEHHNIPINDFPSENISQYFEESYEYIKSVKGNILIHCQAGVSRSATIVIAFLMKEKGISFETAINLVRTKREIISPNFGFRQQLIKYQQELGIKD